MVLPSVKNVAPPGMTVTTTVPGPDAPSCAYAWLAPANPTTPAGLTTQWQEEMDDKFGFHFEIFGRDFLAINPRIWEYKAAAIASLDRLKRAEHKRFLLESRKWDLIIFDEAHRLSAMDYGSRKCEKTQNYRLAEEISHKHYSDSFLLLTATPHQGEENHSRFKNLVRLLDDDVDFTGLDNVNLFSGSGRPFTELVIRSISA